MHPIVLCEGLWLHAETMRAALVLAMTTLLFDAYKLLSWWVRCTVITAMVYLRVREALHDVLASC